jgi:hypothetical protein
MYLTIRGFCCIITTYMSELKTNLQEFTEVARTDLKEASRVKKVALAAIGAVVGVHESLMEVSLATTAAFAYENFGHQPLVAGGTMGALSVAVELAVGAGTAYGLHHFRNTANFLERKRQKKAKKISKTDEAMNTVALTMALGSPAIVARDFARHPEKSTGQLAKTGAKAAGALGAYNTVVGSVVSGGVRLTEALGSGNPIAEHAVTIAETPWTYVGAFALYKTSKFGVGKYRSRKVTKNAAESPEATVLNTSEVEEA